MEQNHAGLSSTRTMSLLKDIAEALNEANDIQSVMAALLPLLAEMLDLHTAWAFRFDPTRSCFVEVGASGLPPALSAGDAEPLRGGWCECQSQFTSGSLSRAVNIVRCSRLRDATGDKQGLAFHASVPLHSHGKPLGILNVAASGTQAFGQDVLELLELISHQVAVAVDRAGLLAAERERAEKLQQLSAISARLVSLADPDQLLQAAVEAFVEELGYEACGITQVDAGDGQRLVAAAHQSETQDAAVYRYHDESAKDTLPEEEQVILADAASVLTQRIPNTDYSIRLESRYRFAFNEIDKDILSAMTWHVFASLEYARLHQQSVASAKWTERRRLAADLHDSVSQRLFSAILLARTACLVTGDPNQKEKATELLTKIQILLAESQEEMRTMIRALRPATNQHFIAALEERVHSLQLQHETHLQLTHQGCETLPLPGAVREALLRATDEALQNALKHASASHVFISVQRQEGDVLLTVSDDGVGFDRGGIQNGLGMSTMQERLEAVGGSIRIRSTIGAGTTVAMKVPVSLNSEG